MALTVSTAWHALCRELGNIMNYRRTSADQDIMVTSWGVRMLGVDPNWMAKPEHAGGSLVDKMCAFNAVHEVIYHPNHTAILAATGKTAAYWDERSHAITTRELRAEGWAV